MAWDDFDSVLAEIEGRNPISGREYVEKTGYDAAAAMRRLYAKRRAQGLTAKGTIPKVRQPSKWTKEFKRQYMAEYRGAKGVKGTLNSQSKTYRAEYMRAYRLKASQNALKCPINDFD